MNLDLLLLPCLAGLLILVTHVPLGRVVLAHGIIFVDLAIAQLAGLGALAASTSGFADSAWMVQGAALGTALTGGLLLTWTEKHFADIQEALIGLLFVLSATAGVLMLAGNPQAGEHLRELLVGQILWITEDAFWPAIASTLVVLGGMAYVQLKVGSKSAVARLLFYLLFAIAVTASVQLVGVYLVFASLIIPAVAVRGLGDAPAIATGLLVGSAGYAGGLYASLQFDLPAGALIVWCMALAGLLVLGGRGVAGMFLSRPPSDLGNR